MLLEILRDVVDGIDYYVFIQEELKRNGISILFLNSESELKATLDSLTSNQNPIIITDRGFAGQYIERIGMDSKHVFKISREDMENVGLAESVVKKYKMDVVIGFGGGRALDVAKKLAYNQSLDLILVPTAPSHDGIISRTASLYDGERKTSFVCKYAGKIVVPLNLWASAERHNMAGVFDVLGNIVALQDVFLANRMKGEEIKERELKLSALSILLISNAKGEKDMAYALFASALAMKQSSRYCSGSEHELEKTLAPHFQNYMHGELVGISTLICAYIYSTHSTLPTNLLFPNHLLFSELNNLYSKLKLNQSILQILNDPEFRKNSVVYMKKASEIRPERYTLWNAVNSEKVKFDKILNHIEKLI